MKRCYTVEFYTLEFWRSGKGPEVATHIDAPSPDAAIQSVMRSFGLSVVSEARVWGKGIRRSRAVVRSWVTLTEGRDENTGVQ